MVGLTIVNRVCTGLPSRASYSIGCSRKQSVIDGPAHVQHDGIAHVRDRDPIADGRGRDRLASQEYAQAETDGQPRPAAAAIPRPRASALSLSNPETR